MQKNGIVATRTIPGVDESTRNHLADGLNKNLANVTDLTLSYKQAHWNVIGRDFYQLHAMYEEFAQQTREFSDLLAERAVTLGSIARGTLQAAVDNTELQPFPVEEREETRQLDKLVSRIDKVIDTMRQTMEESADGPVTQDLYTTVLAGLEKQRWMLEAHI